MAKKVTILSPLYDRLLVEIAQAEEKIGLIIVPDVAKDPLNQGIVRAAGDGRMLENGTFIPLKVKVGDTVMFGRFAGQKITIDGREVLIVREDEVMGIVVEIEIPDAPTVVDPPQEELA